MTKSSPPRPRSPRENAAALVDAAEHALERGEPVRACELAGRAVAAADRHPEGSARSRARRMLAAALLAAERFGEAASVAEEATRVAHGARSLEEEALAELARAEISRARGDDHAGLHHAQRAQMLADRAGHPPTTRSVLGELALAMSRVGDGESAQELFEKALAIPSTGQPKLQAFRLMCNASSTHRAGGRFEQALTLLDRAEAFARAQHLEAAWELTEARILVYVDIGAGDEAHALLTAFEDAQPESPRILGLQALVALAQGDRPELVEKLTGDALAVEGLAVPKRMAFERMRALSVFARGRSEDAERMAVELASAAARIGSRVHGAQALALAARAGNPDAWLLRWLGALALAQGGVSARVQHEAVAALVGEPDPIGAFARTFVSVARARMVERTPAELRPIIKRTLRQVETRVVALRQAKRAEAETLLDDFVLRAKEAVGLAGSSPALLRPVATMARAAKSNASLVITGETGSGKELFARLAHRLSARKNGPFVAINCAAIPEPLLEAELFGHERGAFTGAERARRGLFVEAEGGTLLLDEVGEMSAAMQVKLLRVLEDREVRAIGGTRGRKVDVRVVAATHRDLAKLVASHVFREDLYYRLAAITVRVPALRERAEDIPAVARALLLRDPATQRHRFDVPALAVLAEHSWPGNVRELANVIRVAAAMTEGTVIGRPELADAIGSRGAHHGATDARSFEETTLSALRARHRAEVREIVGRAIAGADGNKLRAARALGVSRQGLYRILD